MGNKDGGNPSPTPLQTPCPSNKAETTAVYLSRGISCSSVSPKPQPQSLSHAPRGDEIGAPSRPFLWVTGGDTERVPFFFLIFWDNVKKQEMVRRIFFLVYAAVRRNSGGFSQQEESG